MGMWLMSFACNSCITQEIVEFPYAHYICYRTDTPMTIDGKSTEHAWVQAPWTDYFVNIEGSHKPASPWKTRVKMLWDDVYMYFYAEMEEPHIWATMKERDAVIFYDDDFEIFIDPDGDGHNYYEFEVNALNTLWELILLRPYRADKRPKVLNNWNIPNIKTAVDIVGSLNDPSDRDSGWSVEWAIPWDALGELSGTPAPPQHGDQWRVNFSRVDWDMDVKEGAYHKQLNPDTGKPLPEHNWVWQPMGIVSMHIPEAWGFVQFSSESVGSGQDLFVVDPDWRLKDCLWQIYNAQRSRAHKGISLATSMQELGIDISELACTTEPTFHNSLVGYAVSLQSTNRDHHWVIDSEGRLFKTYFKN